MKVKIELDEGQTPDSAEEELYKALNSHRSGDMHSDKFTDPAMEHVSDYMKAVYREHYTLMMNEIMDELDNDYVG